MGMTDDLSRELGVLAAACAFPDAAVQRIRAELEFAAALTAARPDGETEWGPLILTACSAIRAALESGSAMAEAVGEAEAVLAPVGRAAKEYTVHCVGHAHIDMNWQWPWSETVAVINDTFTTVDRLMDEFPDFRFSQSQASVYRALADYLPELREKVKQRIAEGRWEIAASQWVEGDKNLASGEALCRHALYTRRFLADELGLPYDAVVIDFEPDTFGHAQTVPTVLARSGVKWYYFCRGGHGPQLFWWQGKDGSRVLAFDDQTAWYNGIITPELAAGVLPFEQQTGLKDLLFLYGVGDHGGGPTRRDLETARELNSWPIFPNVKLSTLGAFFAIAERDAKALPVVDRELNFVFEGCYTSQARIKRANRISENALVEAECMAWIAHRIAGLPYPQPALSLAWEHTLLSQFHDILPGSGVPATRDHALGRFQDILAQTTMAKTRALRGLSALVDTSGVCDAAPALPPARADVGGGAGDVPVDGAVSRRAGGGKIGAPFVMFNPTPWPRSEVVTVRLWDRDHDSDGLAARDDRGRAVPCQRIGQGQYWGHSYLDVAFPAEAVPGTGYRTYCVSRSAASAEARCSGDGRGRLENEFLEAEVEPSSGALVRLVDKATGIDLVPAGERLGCLEYVLEAPHGMTAWVLGQIVEARALSAGAVTECPHTGPWLASVRSRHRLNESELTVTVSLAAGSPRVEFLVEADWLERGHATIGVPALRAVFPLALAEPVARFECPNGHVERPTDPTRLTTYTYKWGGGTGAAAVPADVPAQKWADLTGRHAAVGSLVGATIVNDSTYGHSVSGSTLRLSLLRSSYDPDPLPEIGHHTIRFAVEPHVGEWSVSRATRAGYAFNLPLNVVGTDAHPGSLPAARGFVEVLSQNVMLSAMKRAEDSDALVLRLYEMEGAATTARVVLDPSIIGEAAGVVETDVLERPLAKSSARLDEGVVTVDIPAFGLATVMVGRLPQP